MHDPIDAVIERLSLLHIAHEPDGWPAVQMRDISALLDETDAARSQIADLCAANQALLAEVEALRQKAARYDWLRAQPNNTDAPRIDVVYWTAEDEASNAGEGLRMEALDAAIDAALRAKEESNG